MKSTPPKKTSKLAAAIAAAAGAVGLSSQAEAQSSDNLVEASAIDGVANVRQLPDGSVELVMDNGQVLKLDASQVTVRNGQVYVDADLADGLASADSGSFIADNALLLGAAGVVAAGVGIGVGVSGGGDDGPTEEADILVGTALADTIDGLGGDDNISGLEGDDNLSGGAGNDTIDGGLGNDSLFGGAGNDTLLGGDGDDLLQGGGGADITDGGAGIDTASFADIGTGVTADLGAGTAQYLAPSGATVIDTLSNIENLAGSANDDSLTGDATDNVLDGAAGNDALFGLGGNDTINGGAGDDVIAGGGGTDVLDGGEGNDTNSFEGIGADVVASLEDGTASYGAVNETFTNFENLTGSDNNDTLSGDAFDNVLTGGLGDDTLVGGVGNDTLAGGDGFDTADFSDLDVPVEIVVDAQGNGTAKRDTGFSVSVADADVAALNGITDAEFVTEAVAGNIYFNIHTSEFTGGEIRGQLDTVVSDDTDADGIRTIVLSADLDAEQEPGPPVGVASDSEATGSATVTIVVDADGNATYSTTLDVEGIAPSELISLGPVSAIHLHNAPAGENGPVVQDVIVDAGNPTGPALPFSAVSAVSETDTLTSIEEFILSDDADSFISSGGGAQTVNAGDGDDFVQAGGGADTTDGGAGIDTVSFDDIGSDVTVDLAAGTAEYLAPSGATIVDTVTNFENVLGSDNNDSITGDANDNVFEGGLGDDALIGGEGSDTADFSDQDVPVNVALDADGNGTATRDTGFSVTVADAEVAALNGITDAEFVTEAVAGNIYFNIHTSEFGGGEIRGQLDTVVSDETDAAGVRTIVLSADLDAEQEPGPPVGVASDSNATGSATVTIVVDTNGDVTYSTTLDVEGIAPSELISLGPVSAIHLHNAPAGQNGPVVQDVIVDAGNPTGPALPFTSVSAVSETDTLTSIENVTGSDDGDVIVFSGAAANTVDGGAGDDLIAGGGGTDILDGGEGNDTNSFQGIGADVVASLADGTASYGAVNETFTNFENLTGSDNNDTLSGDAFDNVLTGGLGDDTLVGGVGNDTLAGGDGFDTADFSDLDVPVEIVVDAQGNGTAKRDTGFSVSVADADVAALNGITDAEFVTEAVAGNIYFNIHTSEFTGGEIRGQLDTVVSDDTDADGIRTIVLSADLDAEQEPGPPVGVASDSEATGSATVTIVVDADGNATYSTTLDVEGIAPSELISLGPVSAIHLHNAPAGENGPVVQDVIVDAGNPTGPALPFSAVSAVSETDTLTSIEEFILSDDADSFISSGGGAQTVNAGDGDDFVQAGGGADTTDGGAGIDTVSFDDIGSDVTVDLAAGTAEYLAPSGATIVDTVTNFENVLGSDNNDSITGDANDNVFEGGLGDDILNGGDGNDTAAFDSLAADLTVNIDANGDGTIMRIVNGVMETDTVTSVETVVDVNGDVVFTTLTAPAAASAVSAAPSQAPEASEAPATDAFDAADAAMAAAMSDMSEIG